MRCGVIAGRVGLRERTYSQVRNLRIALPEERFELYFASGGEVHGVLAPERLEGRRAGSR